MKSKYFALNTELLSCCINLTKFLYSAQKYCIMIAEVISMKQEERTAALPAFLEALTCEPRIWSWEYDRQGQLLSTNASEEDQVLDRVFRHTGCLNAMLEHGKKDRRPLVLSAKLGVLWIAAYGSERIWVLGPVYGADSDMVNVTQTIRSYEMDYITRNRLVQVLGRLPTVYNATFFQIGIWLHYYLTGEKLSRDELVSYVGPETAPESQPVVRKRQRTWQAERTLLKMVRNGDLDYREALAQAGSLSSGVKITTPDPVQQAVLSGVSFTTLCIRAAIEGGLSPETAYTMGDGYIQRIALCKNVTAVREVNHAMYEDFIRRVHRLRENPKLSPQIRLCQDYVELHLEEELSLPALARTVGYTQAYLSRRFKQETGVNLRDFIRAARIERAKILLTTTEESVHDIAERLCFCSPSYFSEVFRNTTGQLPQSYRTAERR